MGHVGSRQACGCSAWEEEEEDVLLARALVGKGLSLCRHITMRTPEFLGKNPSGRFLQGG